MELFPNLWNSKSRLLPRAFSSRFPESFLNHRTPESSAPPGTGPGPSPDVLSNAVVRIRVAGCHMADDVTRSELAHGVTTPLDRTSAHADYSWRMSGDGQTLSSGQLQSISDLLLAVRGRVTECGCCTSHRHHASPPAAVCHHLLPSVTTQLDVARLAELCSKGD